MEPCMVINYCESIFQAVPNILFCMSLEYGVEYEYRKTPIGIYHTTTTNERRLGYLLSKHQTLDTHLRP